LLAVGTGSILGPFLGLGVEKVVAPETFHHLLSVDTKLLGISHGELTNGEGPAVETRAKGNSTLVGVNLDITEDLVKVGGDDDVDGFNGSGERLVQILLVDLEFEEGSVDFVDDDDGLDSFTEGLTEDGFGLDADAFDTVDDDEGSVRDSESGSDFGGKVDVAGRIDKIDQEPTTCQKDRFCNASA
jgi:hypothetical protein